MKVTPVPWFTVLLNLYARLEKGFHAWTTDSFHYAKTLEIFLLLGMVGNSKAARLLLVASAQ